MTMLTIHLKGVLGRMLALVLIRKTPFLDLIYLEELKKTKAQKTLKQSKLFQFG
jgi:hypothetical protein